MRKAFILRTSVYLRVSSNYLVAKNNSQMKFKIFIIIVISISSKFYCQNSNIKLDKDYFVIGTLSDEMGRIKDHKDNETVEKSTFDNFILKYNFNLLKAEYDDLVIDSTFVREEDWHGGGLDIMHTSLKSKKFVTKINQLYTYQFGLDENGKVIDSTFTGTLQKNIFKNKRQRLSFLAGVYCTNGITNEKRYCIRFVNSLGKYSVCVDALKKLGCKNVELTVTQGVPWSETIYFEPTALLKSYLNEFEPIRMKIIKERDKTSKQIANYNKKGSDRINAK